MQLEPDDLSILHNRSNDDELDEGEATGPMVSSYYVHFIMIFPDPRSTFHGDHQ
jgi:hypothetical protein